MNADNARKRGRPPKDQNKVKKHSLRVRFNDEEWNELEKASSKTGLSMSECLRLSLHYQLERLPQVNYFIHK